MCAVQRWSVRSALVVVALLVACLVTSSCEPIGLIDSPIGFSEGEPADNLQFCGPPSLYDLARECDALDRHVELDGSIVADQPSVWGQARLTMYREEFETQMLTQLTTFQPTLQGAVSRSDQAYAADALALSYTAQAASSGSPTGSTSKGSSSSSSSSSSGGGGSGTSTPSTSNPYGNFTGTFDAFNNVTRTPAFMQPMPGFAVFGQKGLSLEPTVQIEQMARYINHLQELRRINDGDDTADSPGYSLNLVRIPVSVLPGRQTQQRYGAEITFSITPHLHEELLPMTFRNLVVNDLLDQIAVPMTQLLNDWDLRSVLYEATKKPQPSSTSAAQPRRISTALPETQLGQLTAAIRISVPVSDKVGLLLNRQLGSATRLKVAQRPFPPSQMVDIYGKAYVNEILSGTYQLTFAVPNKGVVHYPDVQSYIREELNGSYAFLRDAAHNFATGQTRIDLWRFCSPPLVSAIRGRRTAEIDAMRNAFEADVRALGATLKSQVTPALAWAILVDSALLNQQLTQDMTEAAAARGGFQLQGEWLDYFSPEPSPQARQNFNQYVQCRWPIHVFALDPEDDQQNIADSYSMRREMQLAMSMAFVSGNLSANNMFQFARRLEMDMETIAINNTTVGFSHGSETFGWRFYPRFQTPDTDSNVKVFFQDLLCGGPNRKQLLRERMLEPGIRECVAIVIMPSFVPYADMSASSNWFALDNPHRKLLNSTTAVRLSEQAKWIQDGAQMVSDPHCYLNGEVDRLQQRAHQLAAKLPLQSMSVQVPYENTLGGFAMFNTGVTDLAPELLGWYGAPAINLDGSTTIFLIGNHFSVHQTRVIAGGQEIAANSELLSRQVMKVTIPANAISIVEDTGEVYGGWQDPTSETSDARSPDASSSPPPPAAVTSIYTRPTQSISNRGILRFGNDAIQLKDPGLPGTLQQLTLKVNNGTLALGSTDGLCFTTGANGTGSMTVTGTIDRLNTAVNGLTYKPKAAYNGTDTLSMLLQGSGVAPCTVSVAIAVYSWPAFTFVDVHLSTPYGATSHLLIPAWHLGKTGSGNLAPASGGAAGGGSDSSGATQTPPVVSQPQWTSTQLSLGYVAKGLGIAAADPPLYAPSSLTLNMGTQYQVPSDSTVTLTLTLGGAASGSVSPQKITIVPGTGSTAPTNYNTTTHVLTITGQDLTNLANNVFNVIQYEFGAVKPIGPSNTSFTMNATVSGTGQPKLTIVNQLTVTLVSAAAKAATGTTGTTTTGTTTTPAPASP